MNRSDQWPELLFDPDEWPDEVAYPDEPQPVSPSSGESTLNLLITTATVRVPLGQKFETGNHVRLGDCYYKVQMVVGETWCGGATKLVHLILTPVD